jgi:hypothetical protein
MSHNALPIQKTERHIILQGKPQSNCYLNETQLPKERTFESMQNGYRCMIIQLQESLNLERLKHTSLTILIHTVYIGQLMHEEGGDYLMPHDQHKVQKMRKTSWGEQHA